jgi:hypothetical protein
VQGWSPYRGRRCRSVGRHKGSLEVEVVEIREEGKRG